jgi:TetR/AcrR family transcriptional regulator
VVGDPTDEILAVAGHLFGELGVASTSMSRLAAEVGLKQSSLYYYFSRKEEVVAALVARANVIPLVLLRRVAAAGGPPAVQLYRFVVGDVQALCALPFDINEVHRIAARDPEEFAGYWRERASLERQLAHIVKQGSADGTLRTVDPRLTALTLMANDEGVQNWFRVASHYAPSAIGTALADVCIGGLLVRSGGIERTRRAALSDFP